ncbi:MAG TPA: PA2169 family four-helix-bundle protein [Chitinophagaceae bacterium]|nr:PA2169 family four-helix-bundle protein [Chitinophagaceae bacterium]
MERNEQLNEVLNDLVRINNDRVEGYEKAIEETKEKDADLRAVFHRMADESKQYASELRNEIARNGGEIATDTTFSGKIYRMWMDVKAVFTGKGRQSVLASCEYGEDAAQKAYEEALRTDAPLPADVRQLIVNQKASLKTAHDTIKQWRDSYRESDNEGRRAD